MVRALLVLIVSVSGMPPEQKQTSYSLEAGAPREPCDDGDDGGDDGEDFTPGWVYGLFDVGPYRLEDLPIGKADDDKNEADDDDYDLDRLAFGNGCSWQGEEGEDDEDDDEDESDRPLSSLRGQARRFLGTIGR